MTIQSHNLFLLKQALELESTMLYRRILATRKIQLTVLGKFQSSHTYTIQGHYNPTCLSPKIGFLLSYLITKKMMELLHQGLVHLVSILLWMI